MDKQPCPIFSWEKHLEFLLLEFGSEFDLGDDCSTFDKELIEPIEGYKLFEDIFAVVNKENHKVEEGLSDDDFFYSVRMTLLYSLYAGMGSVYLLKNQREKFLKEGFLKFAMTDDGKLATLPVSVLSLFGLNINCDMGKRIYDDFDTISEVGMDLLEDDDDGTYYIDEEIYINQFRESCSAYYRYGIRHGEKLL